MGAGRGFRMVLDAEGGYFQVLHAFQCIVIQVYMREPDRQVRKGTRIDAETVILGR